MNIKLTLFAGARERVGSETVELTFGQGPVTVDDIRDALTAKFPALEPLSPHLLFAAGTDYLAPDSQIDTDSELVCFPPVSGG